MDDNNCWIKMWWVLAQASLKQRIDKAMCMKILGV